MSVLPSSKYPPQEKVTLNFAKYKKQVDKMAKSKILGEFTEDACSNNFQTLSKYQEQALDKYKEQAGLYQSLKNYHSRQPIAQQKAAERYNDVLQQLNSLPDNKKAAEEKVANLVQEMRKLEEPVKKLQLEVTEISKTVTQDTLDKCSEFLAKNNHADVVYIMEKFVTILRGQRADSQSVELYIKSVEGLIMAIQRIDYSKVDVNECKENVKELLGNRAISLGLVVEGSDGQLAASGRTLPEKMVCFLFFYKLLIKLCKLCIAKGDELKIASRVKVYEAKVKQFKIDETKLVNQKELYEKVIPTLKTDDGFTEVTKMQANTFMDCQNFVNEGMEILGGPKVAHDDRNQVLAAIDSVPSFDFESAFNDRDVLVAK